MNKICHKQTQNLLIYHGLKISVKDKKNYFIKKKIYQKTNKI